MGRRRIYSKEEAAARQVETKRAYIERHPERRAATLAKYNAQNAEEVANRKRAWFDRNPDYLRSYYNRKRKTYLVQQAGRRALKLGLPFSISEEDFEIPETCPVLGIELMLNARGSFNPHSPSLDRIVPELGYVKGNVRIVSNRANLLKRDASLEELEALAAYVRRETRPMELGLSAGFLF